MTTQTIILRPIASPDRAASAPRLPCQIVIFADEIVAVHEGEDDQLYRSISDLATDYQTSASELLGHDFGRARIVALAQEAANHDDAHMAAACDRAMAGDDFSYELCADAVLAALLA